MSKGPDWMPLNVGDYLRDTAHLTALEHGAYMLLIMRYWQDGGLPSDETLIRRYSLLTAEQWSEAKPVLVALFDEGWKHKRIDAELAKAADIIGKRKAAGQQRHSTSSAHAEQEDSTSSYTRVPPSPSPLVIEPPASVPVSEARALFDQVWEAFPENPTSSEAKAEAAFNATKASDRPAILAAAFRYRQWFTEDCEARKRTFDEGLRFAPFLATWISGGDWRKASTLPLKAGSQQPSPDLAVIEPGTEDFAAIKRLRGRAPIVGQSGKVTVTKVELEQARAAVH